jgi:regulator of sirC expression with transglutaminase-like and TPR domain
MSYNNLAVISARRKEYQRAIELLNTAILVDANLSEAYRNRAFAYACIHQNVLALDDANMLDALGRRKDADFIRNIINNRPKNEQL